MKYLMFALLLLAGSACTEKNDVKPNQSDVLPFNEFWLSTRFNASSTDFFNSWAIQTPFTTAHSQYHYEASASGQIPDGCSRQKIVDGDFTTFKASCLWTRTGTTVPNQYEWPDQIEFDVLIKFNSTTLNVSDAYLDFKEYGKMNMKDNASVEQLVSGAIHAEIYSSGDITYDVRFLLTQ